MNNNTARNFTLQLGSLITLYASIVGLIMVLFAVITITYPDAIAYSWEFDGAQATIRNGIAVLVVFFPVYLVLTRIVHQIRRKETGTYLTLTKWLVYLSLLVGGGILLGDLVVVILTFLDGEITTRFLLKAASLLLIIGAAFSYYLYDARGYWNDHEDHSKLAGAGAILLVLVALILGFVKSDTPTELRDKRLDQQQVSDLQMIQSVVENHVALKGKLPTTLSEIDENTKIPSAPENRAPYTYTLVNPTTFKLCATFATEYTNPDGSYPAAIDKQLIRNPNNWDHKVGNTCFERVINPV